MIYSHNGIVLSNKKEQTTNMCLNFLNIILNRKSYERECILYDSMDMKAQNRQIYVGKKSKWSLLLCKDTAFAMR